MSVSSKAETDNQKDKKTETYFYTQKTAAVLTLQDHKYTNTKPDEKWTRH